MSAPLGVFAGLILSSTSSAGQFDTMRPSLPLFIRLLSRGELKLESQSRVVPQPLSGPIRSDKKRPTFIQLLRAEKRREGASYPSNVRIEPVLQRHVLAKVDPKIRKQFLDMMKEH